MKIKKHNQVFFFMKLTRFTFPAPAPTFDLLILFQLLLRLPATSAVRTGMRANKQSSTVSPWVILTLSGPGASSTTASTGYVIKNTHWPPPQIAFRIVCYCHP